MKVLRYYNYFNFLGAMSTPTKEEILYARQKMVLVAKAFGLQAIDMVNINFKDLKKLKQECESGAKMGFTGIISFKFSVFFFFSSNFFQNVNFELL